MEENIKIFETAFVTADFRALDVALSKDIYAHLWPSQRTRKYGIEYANKVSKYEPFAHCLRNRFFLDEIRRLYNDDQIEMLINFGCGFSMYPFLLPKGLSHIEIDMPDSIAYKKEKIEAWQKDNSLPKRTIHFLSADFNTDYEPFLKKQIREIKGNKKVFILLEGVLFFISRHDTNKLFSFFAQIQSKNEYVGSVSFQKAIELKPAFKRLEKFTEERLDFNEKFCYQTVEDSYYESLEDYTIIDHQNTFSLNQKYSKKDLFVGDVLDEHMYLLKKN